MLGQWLAEWGRSVVVCRTFHDAKAYLADNTPDVIITDIRLQDYNGLQLVVHMGAKRQAPTCIVMTGHDDPVLRREAEQMHALYMVKPFGRKDFLDAIDELVAASREGRLPRRRHQLDEHKPCDETADVRHVGDARGFR